MKNDIDLLMSINGVDTYDLRYMTPGVSADYMRLEEGKEFYNYNNRLIINGKVEYVNLGNISQGTSFIEIHLEEYDLVAGSLNELDYDFKISSLGLLIDEGSYGRLHNGKRVIRLYDESYKYDKSYFEEFQVGENYYFVLRYELNTENYMYDDEIYVGDHLSDQWLDAIHRVSTEDSSYNASLQLLKDIINRDQYTFDVVYSDYMSSIRTFVEKKSIIYDGRMIERSDSDEKKICMCHQ